MLLGQTLDVEAAASMHRGACKYQVLRCSHIYLSAIDFTIFYHRYIRNDFGIRTIIAPSFAEIFKSNSMQNGMLPITLSPAECEQLAADAKAHHELEVDLEKQEVRSSSGAAPVSFTVDPFRRHCLLNGLDDIGLTMQKGDRIDVFETRRSSEWPWLDGYGYKGKEGTGGGAIPGSENGKGLKKLDW